ncbi:triose-phosphate isomerase [Candidatus Pacearchaeota archaeon]|nr:triose-phosphate isomerase [Candidatus Pacearchaeota archaeon]
MKPVIIINFKTSLQGKKTIAAANAISRISSKISARIILAVQATDIYEIRKKISKKILVYSEHADYQTVGKNTGFVLPEAVKVDGGKGTLLNHSEHPLTFPVLKKTVIRCKKLKLQTAIFAKNLTEAQKITALQPDYLIYEPPHLVGGKKSVSLEQPGIIQQFAESINRSFLVGAGIHSNKDVSTALKLGASGITISSAIVLAKDPGKQLLRLVK